ncbi:E3 ubiquitin-protein ligase bre1, variant 2 [Cadophora gregata]|uniref:E3 ubiquitin-protein ligase bre1, variant 2 n=1 Tax=Cadophora gregata TaxID=51156 RepID=UPI0026DCE48B|nr:E3 ubiquitin-protein ligase bre1, variant 2 [Cadophora gregata]KAK0124646.1 E3 ubiquitin-protein ligase bre1, variant 2 [Cadophora gregata]KAK0129496.1 E3 ubiquitin-protein ligase bre1, variant 3 [Cadophora gregata f. sp. sojae]
MPISTPLAPSHPSFIKMEDRKRSAGEDLAPPTKRQAVNGKASADADMPWAADLEEYQKDAIYRRMLEYKREAATFQSQVKELQKRATDHDDHLRVADQWWSQLLDEVTLLAQDLVPEVDNDASFPTALNFKGSEDFQSHLASKARDIKSKLQIIFTRLASARGEQSPDIEELQGKLTKLLASQREYVVKLDRLRTERDQLEERLESASLRCIKAEKKYDRARSSAVAKLEQQAINGSGNSAGSGIGNVENGDTEMTNGISEVNEASQTAYKEASAIVEKQKEQLEAIAAENKTLTEQLTLATTRFSNLTEDDYARTDLFKQFRAQHEDVIRRINHLEATNIQLREDAEKHQAERTAFRTQVEGESEITTCELESQLQRVETDLTRIRATRDELLADQSIRKASQDSDRPSNTHFKDLVAGRDERITALECEIERLKASINEQSCELTPRPEIDSLDLEQLRRKYETLERQFDAINKELPAMQNAYTKVQALSTKKVIDLSILEEKIQIVNAEKAKADQKYFAARKDMDTRILEVRALKGQNAKSSEIISQLKDVETANRTLLSNLEKQLSDMKQSNTSVMAENKKMESTSRDATSKAETLTKQVTELTNLLKAKDANNLNTKERIRAAEVDLEKLQVKYDHVQKERDQWKAKSLGKQSGEEEMLRVCFPHHYVRALLIKYRHSLFARFVGRISRTRLSGHVVTHFAIIVLKIA